MSTYQNFGAIPIEEADDMNIPVNCLIVEPDPTDEGGLNQWLWTADNFMPRRGRVEEGQYEVRADTREALIEAVNEYVVPLYQAALTNMQKTGENYYWRVET